MPTCICVSPFLAIPSFSTLGKLKPYCFPQVWTNLIFFFVYSFTNGTRCQSIDFHIYLKEVQVYSSSWAFAASFVFFSLKRLQRTHPPKEKYMGEKSLVVSFVSKNQIKENDKKISSLASCIISFFKRKNQNKNLDLLILGKYGIILFCETSHALSKTSHVLSNL